MLANNEKGQSLIEVLVVLVVGAMMIVALITIILSGLKNAQFAQNLNKATKLGQDTIDKIRILRDNNKVGTLIDSNLLPDTCFNLLWSSNCSSACYYKLNANSTLEKVDVNLSKENLSEGFYRQIMVSQPAADYANLTVQISWKDSSGDHNSDIETIITKPNYDCVQ